MSATSDLPKAPADASKAALDSAVNQTVNGANDAASTSDATTTEAAASSNTEANEYRTVFSDATNGDTTYSVGRFLHLVPEADGSVVVDFNRAVLPPCAFSYHFNCPIPPQQNRLSIPITAGEKIALSKDGEPLHY